MDFKATEQRKITKSESEQKPESNLRAVKSILEPQEIVGKAEELFIGELEGFAMANNISELAGDMLPHDSVLRAIIIDKLFDITKVKKATWKQAIKDAEKSKPKLYNADNVPSHVNSYDYIKYGFYIDDGCYHFNTLQGALKLSNFVMRPLFHVISLTNSKRLFEIENEYNYSEILELNMDELVSISNFNKHVESRGNFLFEGAVQHLTKLKRYWYENTKTCYEVVQMGWQPEGFFAWANGIHNGNEFVDIDNYGICDHEENNYYIPAMSKIFIKDKSLYITERQFRHTASDTEFHKFASKLHKVHGNNGLIGLLYMIATINKDIIVRTTNNFPILNLFGPKGAGKTVMARTLLQCFGTNTILPNIQNTTIPGLSDHVASAANALLGIDEYKNSMEPDKIEFLKGTYDLAGRTRMNMDKDRKKEMTKVDCGVILCGQEMPTADIALFSRLIFCSFTKTEYTETEKRAFEDLDNYQKKGLTKLVNEVLSHRDHFIKNYHLSYDKVAADLSELIPKRKIEDRIYRNYLMILAAFHCLRDRLSIGFEYKDLKQIFADNLILQNEYTRKSNELAVFWSIVEYLVKEGLIENEVDYRIEVVEEITIKGKEEKYKFPRPTKVLLLNHTRVFILYRKHGRQSNESILPVDTAKYYLRNNKAYVGDKGAVRFKKSSQDPETAEGKKNFQMTTSMVFIYDDLNVDIQYMEETASGYEIDETGKAKNYRIPEEDKQQKLPLNTPKDDLPF